MAGKPQLEMFRLSGPFRGFGLSFERLGHILAENKGKIMLNLAEPAFVRYSMLDNFDNPSIRMLEPRSKELVSLDALKVQDIYVTYGLTMLNGRRS